MGERRSVTYPDGAKASYHYDGLLRLERMELEESGRTGMPAEIRYRYDEAGRLAEKEYPGGMNTRWHYDGYGRLEELVHADRDGMLDRFRYEYDMAGNKAAIVKERRGLAAESGRYEYRYDPLGRLAGVLKDGHDVRGYTYDSFGNRSGMEDLAWGKTLSYTYDVLDRLVCVEERGTALSNPPAVTEYFYDGRGNMVREETGGKLLHGYEYGAMNRLSKAWDADGREAFYHYNGLGQRTGKEMEGGSEDYLLDLTRPYHNLLGMEKNGWKQDFYADWNITAMKETAGGSDRGRVAFHGLHCYLQDELGSPLRVSGYRAGEGIPGCRYLTYGYDEFGNDTGKELEKAGIPSPYDVQGVEQPFGYTGYRHDGISGTYFAQAREYRPGDGRFMEEDVVKGNGILPQTLNSYGYCHGNPMVFVDGNGKFPTIPITIPVPIGPRYEVENIIDKTMLWAENNPDNVIAQVLTGEIQFEFSDEEKSLMMHHPMQAAIFIYDGYRATKLTQEKFGYMPKDGTIGNAYRHALWNALLKQDFHSEETAKRWTDAHENYPEEILTSQIWEGHTRKEHCEMDLHNNAVGRSVIKWYEFWVSEDEISDRIMKCIYNGEMVTLVEDSNFNWEGTEY